jgi:amino acid permease
VVSRDRRTRPAHTLLLPHPLFQYDRATFPGGADVNLIAQLLRHKSIEQLQAELGTRRDFRRVLGLWQLTAIGIGGIIGVGIFVLAGQQAATNAGPAVVLSFLLAGIASAAAALCYAEFSGLIPVTGSAYTYGYAVLGELPAWLIGWDLLLEYAALCSKRTWFPAHHPATTSKSLYLSSTLVVGEAAQPRPSY